MSTFSFDMKYIKLIVVEIILKWPIKQNEYI